MVNVSNDLDDQYGENMKLFLEGVAISFQEATGEDFKELKTNILLIAETYLINKSKALENALEFSKEALKELNDNFKIDIEKIIGEINLDKFIDEKLYKEWIKTQLIIQMNIPVEYGMLVNKAIDKTVLELDKTMRDINAYSLKYGEKAAQKIIAKVKKRAIENSNIKAKLNFWARDQAGNFVANQTKAMFNKYGLERYRWITKGDSRVRDYHAVLDGLEFFFGESPIGYEPGEDYACRCGYELVQSEVKEKFL